MDNSSIRRRAIDATKDRYDGYLLFSVVTIVLSTFANAIVGLGVLLKPVFDLNVYGVFSNREYDKMTKDDLFKNFKTNWHNAFGYTVRSLVYILLPILAIAAGCIVLSLLLTAIGATSWNAFSVCATLASAVTVIGFIAGYVIFIIRSFAVKLGSYIIYREPEISSRDALKKSVAYMNGNKLQFFLLNLYLIPEYIQNIVLFYGMPKIHMAHTMFFEEVYNRRNSQPSVGGVATFCPKCGAKLSGDSVFCPECGNKVA